jgi:probable F420-dependent oxidoreductase
MPHPFRFGVVAVGAESRAAWINLAHRAESLGYASLLMPDRPSMGQMAPLTALATAAAVTTTLRVGSYVFCNDYRHPLLLAKEAATLDLLSEGRFEFGLGAGRGGGEYEKLGLPFDPPAERVSRFAEALQIIKLAFTAEQVDFTGKYYTIRGMAGLPKPQQQPHPPIMMGSGGQRMLTIAGREAQIVGPARALPRPGAPPDAPLEEKVDWVRQAAGDRFPEIELAQTAYDITLTDGPVGSAAPVGGPPIPKRFMSTDEAVAELTEMRARYGFSYIQFFSGQMENCAPLVARLAGT